MAYTFRKIGVDLNDSFYRARATGDFIWVDVRVGLENSDNDTVSELKIPVAMSDKPLQTMDEFRNAALAEARRALREALDALERMNYAELVAVQTQLDDRS